MNTILIILGLLGIGYWGFYTGKPSLHQPLDFQNLGPKALIGGIILLVIGIFI